MRLEGEYFALATLGIGQVVILWAVSWESLTGGANGLPGVPTVVLFGWEVARGKPLLLFVWSFVGITALAAWFVSADCMDAPCVLCAIARRPPSPSGLIQRGCASLHF